MGNSTVPGSGPCFSRKLFRAFAKAVEHEGWIFFGTVRLFFEFFCLQRVPLQIFDILQQTEVSKSPKGLPFQVFRHYETFKILIFRFFFQIFLPSKGPAFNFLIFCYKLVTPFTILKLCGFWAIDTAPTLDVPVLFNITWSAKRFFPTNLLWTKFEFLEAESSAW